MLIELCSKMFVTASAWLTLHVHQVVAHGVAYATLLNIIRVPDGIWIGADGRRSTGNQQADVACKIHETKFGLIAKASATQGFTVTGQDYSLDKVLFDTIEASHTVAEFKQLLKSRYEQDIRDQMSHLLKLPSLSQAQFNALPMDTPMPPSTIAWQFRQVLLISAEQGEVTVRQLMVAPASRQLPGGKYIYYTHLLDWTIIDSNIIRPEDVQHPSLRQFAETLPIAESDLWIQQNPEAMLRKMLAQGSRDKPNAIGPPFSISHVRLATTHDQEEAGISVTWVEHGACPNWNFKVYDLRYIKQNEMSLNDHSFAKAAQIQWQKRNS